MVSKSLRALARDLLLVALMITLFGLLAGAPPALFAQAPVQADDAAWSATTFAGLELRAIGPALMSGRIADIALHPEDPSTWYVAAGSGGVWKTTDAGTTWTPIFDDHGSYSIGALTVDPSAPETIWVGTGENVSGRHVAWGDGIYRSRDAGGSFEKLGLETSEHIGKIVVHPEDSNVVWVAAEGPLWSAGGERGVFKTTDGGETWRAVLEISEDTGATDLEIHPENPDVLWAATYQRRRRTWSLLAGGPESGIYKSTDGGETWREITKGLPSGDMGKIGLAVSPVDPAYVYATIEASEEERGFYRSTDGGESFEKRNSYLSGGTGPHYYQEIYASPFERDLVYQMDVFAQITRDGGTTFAPLGEPDKHSDNHAMAFHPTDPERLILGSDGGVYQTFDHGGGWRHVSNLPLTQFYKMALDDAAPFYNVVGGTQDNGTQLGPSRTLHQHGILNRDWIVPYGADGYGTDVDPTDPNLVYVSWQGGHLLRWDKRTGEALDVQPQPAPGDPPERWNWDSPVLVSPHAAERLYFGSQRLWRSEDRGDSWTAISGDLSRGIGRYQKEIAGREQGATALWGNTAMSWYGNLTAISESPVEEGVLWLGSDDGLVHTSRDGGASWTRVELPPGVPETAFVNDVEASVHDSQAAFVVLDNHKTGDYAPYVLTTRDGGETWTSVAGDLPANHVGWAFAQDHVDPALWFLATEYGIFFTRDGGERWIELSGGVPTIAFRDLEIQRRESDLVGASFGRGFYVLDDYSPLRGLDPEALADDLVFPVRDAWWYVPTLRLAVRDRGMLGSDLFLAPNPPHGAVVTYWLAEDLESAPEARHRLETEARDDGEAAPFPSFEELRAEELEPEPRVLVTVRNAEGSVVRRLDGPTKKGFHRVAWDLRYPAFDPIVLELPSDLPPWAELPQGPLALPGRYTATVEVLTADGSRQVGEPQGFEVRELDNQTLSPEDRQSVLDFQLRTGDLVRTVSGAAAELGRGEERLRYLEKAVLETPSADAAWLDTVAELRSEHATLRRQLVGDPIRQRFEEPAPPSILERVRTVVGGHWDTRSGPTATHRQGLETAESEWREVSTRLESWLDDIETLESRLEEAGAPYTPGRSPR